MDVEVGHGVVAVVECTQQHGATAIPIVGFRRGTKRLRYTEERTVAHCDGDLMSAEALLLLLRLRWQCRALLLHVAAVPPPAVAALMSSDAMVDAAMGERGAYESRSAMLDTNG